MKNKRRVKSIPKIRMSKGEFDSGVPEIIDDSNLR